MLFCQTFLLGVYCQIKEERDDEALILVVLWSLSFSFHTHDLLYMNPISINQKIHNFSLSFLFLFNKSF